jgi:hypothetical protein
MIYIQISNARRANALLAMLKSGLPVVCLAGKIYGVSAEHLKILKRKRIPFRKLETSKVRMPEPSFAV